MSNFNLSLCLWNIFFGYRRAGACSRRVETGVLDGPFVAMIVILLRYLSVASFIAVTSGACRWRYFLVPPRKYPKNAAGEAAPCLAPARQATSPGPVGVPGVRLGENACVARRPRPLAQVASSATGGAPIAPPTRRAFSLLRLCLFASIDRGQP